MGEEAHFPPMASHTFQWDLQNADRHRCIKAADRLLTSITALHTDAPLMLGIDCDILAAPIPNNNVIRNPTPPNSGPSALTPS